MSQPGECPVPRDVGQPGVPLRCYLDMRQRPGP
ncbi:DUF6207 family protein [Streptomyces sp. NPDC048045]